jgi:sugar O-acyltransferase (sialic acid O-acetyltransferase NeuD family)
VSRAPLIVLGAGRQGRNVTDLCRALGFVPEGFLDDTMPAGTVVDGVPVVGPFSDLGRHLARADATFAVAVGAAAARRAFSARIPADRRPALVHPTAVLAAAATVLPGAFVAEFCRVRSGALVGQGALVESHSGLGVDSRLGDFATTGPGVQATAGTRVGEEAFLGANAVVANEARVGARAVVAAGAVVLEDVPDGAFVAGVPAVVRPRAAAPGQEPRRAGGYRAPST